MVLVVDENSKKIIDNVLKEDDILNENIASMSNHPQLRANNPQSLAHTA